MVVIIIGESCVGKSTSGQFLSESYGFIHIEASSVFNTLYHSDTGEVYNYNEENLEEFYLRNGKYAVAKELVNMHISDNNYVITGLRFNEEISYIRTCIGDVILILLKANPILRYVRSVLRYREDLNLNPIKYLNTNKLEIICDCNVVINNSVVKKSLYNNIKSVCFRKGLEDVGTRS